jgi:PhnB protein
MRAKNIPQGLSSVTPFLAVPDVSKEIEFLKRAFDGEELFRSAKPDGKVVHAMVQIGDSKIMIGDTDGQGGPMHNLLYHYVDDADAVFDQAMRAGGNQVAKPEDQFFGDRAGAVKDPAGNVWWIATHIEDVSDEELAKRQKDPTGMNSFADSRRSMR